MTSSQRYRILLVTNLCPPDFDGGYGLRAFEVATALRQRGHHVDVLTSKYRECFRGPRVGQESVYRLLRYVRTSNSKTVWRYLDRIPRRIACTTVAKINAPAVRGFLKAKTYDLAYCFALERVGLATVKPIVDEQIPILWHAGDTYLANQLYGFAERYPGYRCLMSTVGGQWFADERALSFEHVAFVSEFLRQECERMGFHPRNSFVIPRGFSGTLMHDVDHERASPPTFFMACRVEENKGVHVAARAASILLRKRPELCWRLDIAGATLSGYLRRVLRDIRRSGIDDRVAILGPLPHQEVMARMRRATAFLSCSTYGEPFASTIIEALASGTPLIGSNVGSILEVVTPDESALVYKHDDPEALAEQMEAILENESVRRRLATAGLRVVRERYTLESVLNKTEDLFADIVTAHERTKGSLGPQPTR